MEPKMVTNSSPVIAPPDETGVPKEDSKSLDGFIIKSRELAAIGETQIAAVNAARLAELERRARLVSGD